MKQILIQSTNRSDNGVEIFFAENGSTEIKHAVVSGVVFANVLKGANLPNIPATYRNIAGAKALADFTDVKAGDTFITADGSLDKYRKNHCRINRMAITNGQEIYDKLTVEEVKKDEILFNATAVEFVAKPANTLRRSLVQAVEKDEPETQPETQPELQPEPAAEVLKGGKVK